MTKRFCTVSAASVFLALAFSFAPPAGAQSKNLQETIEPNDVPAAIAGAIEKYLPSTGIAKAVRTTGKNGKVWYDLTLTTGSKEMEGWADISKTGEVEGAVDETLTPDQIPSSIREAAKKNLPDEYWPQAAGGKQAKGVYFEISRQTSLKDGSTEYRWKRRIKTGSVTMSGDGKKVGLSEELEAGDLPKAITSALDGAFKDYRVTWARRKMDNGKASYSMSVKLPGSDQEIDVYSTEDGKLDYKSSKSSRSSSGVTPF